MESDARAALKLGFTSGLLTVATLGAALLPARLGVALRGWGSGWWRVAKALAGAWLDLSAVALPLVVLVALVVLVLPLGVRRLRGARWQALAAPALSLPLGFLLWVLTVTAQEVKSERGSFPTMFDLAEGGTNAAFVTGMMGFIAYQRIWLPALVGIALAVSAGFVSVRRQRPTLGAWRAWSAGTVAGLVAGLCVAVLGANGLAAATNAFSPAALGDPLTGLVESTIDVLHHRGPSTARELVLDIDLPAVNVALGEQRLGWPPARADAGCAPYPWSRPLDTKDEPWKDGAPGKALVTAFEQVSDRLFSDGDGRVAVFFLSLEGFRADDVHALHALAPKQIAPWTTRLYEAAGKDTLAGHRVFQGGVRTAHGLGAMMCGLGTLPYNLSFIRDLQPFNVRCLSDVLADAGFRHSFFYGSDATFDEMKRYFTEHRYQAVVSQAELPKGLPLGTWDGVTDFAVFDEAVKQTAEALATGPQFSLVMSLSNHSPFTPPQDLPASVRERVDEALRTAEHRADSDDRLRLVTYSYTDAAVERLFASLEERGIADRALVVLMADHSTGHAYVWGKEDPENDDEKTQVPFVVAIPPAFRQRLTDQAGLDEAMQAAQRALDATPLSLNDVPRLMAALLARNPGVSSLKPEQRWHSFGGQITSPWFRSGGADSERLMGINGVSEFFALDSNGQRVGGYEDSVFLKTRADRYRVTPRLIPVAATLRRVLLQCSNEPATH